MFQFIAEHFISLIVGFASLLLICLQAWQWHLRALSRQKLDYEKILNNMLEGFVLQTADGRIIEFNSAAHRILGLTEDELLGRTSIDPRWQTYREDGSPFPGTEHPSMVTLASGKIMQNVIMGVHCAKGENRWISINTVPLFNGDEANPSHVVCTFKDITEGRMLAEDIRLAKQRLELAVKAGGIGIYELDKDGSVAFWDPQMYEIYAMNPHGGSTPLEHWRKVIHPEDKRRTVKLLIGSIRTGQEFHTTFRIVMPRGEIKYIRAMGVEVEDKIHNSKKMLGVNWDVTEQVEKEVLLQHAKDRAEEASRAKSEFLANMSHEIRTPLNGIFGMVALLKDSPLSKVQLEMLQTVESCSEGLLNILNDVLDLSRIDSRRLQIEVASFDVVQSIEQVIKLLQPLAQQKNLPIHLNFDPALPREVLGDSARVKQILLNLLSNAIKFTNTGEIRIEAVGELLESQKIHYRIKVIDTGIGISRENQGKLFQAFTQADSSISRRFGGTGLGLVISSRLAELMGGTLIMVSELGEGSEFCLDLTLAVSSDAEDRASIQGMSSALAVGMDRSKRILIVEDNKINQIVITSLLDKMGFKWVDVVEDGLMALQQLELKSYDVIFMDMQMPGMDGLTATRRIRERLRNRPLLIVAMTANAFDSDREKCLEAGMDEFLVKPFKQKELERILCYPVLRKTS